MLMCIIALALCGLSNDCFAGDRARGVEFKCITPGDVLLGTGVFLHDTGSNLCDALRVTVDGLGRVVTSPLRGRLCLPKTRTFIFEPPKLRLQPWRFYEVLPSKRVIPPAPVEEPCQDFYKPLHYKPSQTLYVNSL